ncbi:unnamed protein product, partial [Urochloa humidicola]
SNQKKQAKFFTCLLPSSSSESGGGGGVAGAVRKAGESRGSTSMGKQKGRASSSGMAASLVPHAQGAVPTVGFGGYHGAVRVEPAAPSDPDSPIRLTPDVDGEVLQNLKRLGRKDPTTK